MSLAPTPADSTAAVQHPREYLTFRLGSEEYGIDILTVQEIRSHEPPTRIAHAPAHLKGVLNLRGVIVPVVDLRERFGCDRAELNAFTVVIVLHIGTRTVGIVVDSVSDVLELAAGDIKPAPAIACTIDATYITGLGSVADRTLILLDIQALLAAPEMGLIDAALAA